MTLYTHQSDIISQAPTHHGLWWSCGIGKTLAAIRLAEQHADNILVVCIKNVKDNWPEEIKTWKTKDKNWHVVTKEEFKRDWKKLVGKYDGLVLDEAQYFEGMKSQMHKNLIKYLAKSPPKCMYLLTANPYLSTPWNVFALEKIFGRTPSYAKYRRKFFFEQQMGSRKVPVIRKGIEDEIAKITKSLGSVIHRDDVFDVPDIIYKTEYFKMTSDQNKALKVLEDDPMISNDIVYWTKSHQICGGTLKSTGERFKCEKLSRLKEYAKENKKFVVFARYNAELAMIQETLGERVVVVNGTTKNREQIFKDANKSENTILAINATISAGYNLQEYEMIIFYSNDFSWVNREQAEGRVQRGEYRVARTIIDFLIPGTVDEDVWNCLKKKEDFSVAIYN